MKSFLTLLPIALTLSACATVTADSDQLIEVSTTPAGANCILSNSDGSWTIDKTPGSVIVDRSYEPLSVGCTLAGVGSASTLIEAKTRGRAYGNILLLGIPALIDAKTGSGYEYAPANINLPLASPQAK